MSVMMQPLKNPLPQRLDFKKGINETFIELTVQATAVCTCARCLKLFERQFDFTRNFIVSPENLTETENEIPVDSNRNLDVEQLVLQELSLEIPSVLLCKEDCRGCAPCAVVHWRKIAAVSSQKELTQGYLS